MPKLRFFIRSLWLFVALTLTRGAPALGAEYATVYVTFRSAVYNPGSRGTETQCTSLIALSQAVEQRLQRSLFVTAERADLRVAIAFGHSAEQWYADIELANAHGQRLGHRRISSASKECSGLDDSLALVVALMVDLTREEVERQPAETAVAPPSDGSEVRVPAKAPTPSIPPTPPVPPPTPPSHSWEALTFVGVTTSLGRVPGIGEGVLVAAEIRSRSALSIELGMEAYLPVELEDQGAEQARFTHYGATAALCWFVARRESHQLQLCGGPEVGIERARGVGYRTNRIAQKTSSAPFLRLQSTYWPLPWLGVRLALGAATPLERQRFYATRADGTEATLFHQATIVPFLSLGFSLAL